MGEISDAALIAELRRHLAGAVARQTVAASNLANVNTPGYRTRELDFSEALDREIGAGGVALASTTGGHARAEGGGAPATREVEGLAARRDGNNVQIDRELLEMSRASGEFQRAQTALAAKFRLVRYAINEGR
jgi:flagellar basal-body rod protein FlgB